MKDKKKLKNFTNKFKSEIKSGVKNVMATDEIFHESEIHANRLTAFVMLLSIILLIITVIFNDIGIYDLDKNFLNRVSAGSIIGLFIPWALSVYYKYEADWIKYVCLLSITLVYAAIDSMLTYQVYMIMAIPVLLSSRYYSRKLTISVAVLSVIVFGISSNIGIFYGLTDLNYVIFPTNTAIDIGSNILDTVETFKIDPFMQEMIILFRGYLPKLFSYFIVAVISIQVSSRGRQMVIRQDMISREHSRVETELEVARAVQRRALPIVHTLGVHPEFDLAASMNPAKEIGGDFYDFFFVDPTHLALIIADVSGKGVPAALFMMVSKIYLDNSINGQASPAQILAEVNHHICEKDLDNMFVTVWLGILNLENGKLVSASAGHEYPLVCRQGSSFEVIRDKHGLVLGGMDGVRYRETEIQLYPGDTLFVYTDGVPDATNPSQERFGVERAVESLNKIGTTDMDTMINAMSEELKNFSGDEPQFDDTTMMALKLHAYKNPEGITVRPDVPSIPVVEAFLENEMLKAGVDKKTLNRINICVDEIYPNVVQYSGATWAEISIHILEDKVTITIKDNGIPFDPLKKEEPDTTLNVEDRIPGGLGILMTKKLMDKTIYQYINGQNVFHMIKNR